jgi:hypothetical protein
VANACLAASLRHISLTASIGWKTPLLPEGDALRRAVAWLGEQRSWTPELIDQASRRFDLSPTDEEFLLQESRRFHKQDVPPPND